MSLAALNTSAIQLLDALAVEHGANWVRCVEVQDACEMTERTARRAWLRLRAYKLVQRRRVPYETSWCDKQVRTTELGRALIAACYADDYGVDYVD